MFKILIYTFYNNGVIYNGKYNTPSSSFKSLVWRIIPCARYSLYLLFNLFNDVNVYLSHDFTSIGIILCFDVIKSLEI